MQHLSIYNLKTQEVTMAINTFSDRIVRRLNELAPNDDWVTAHWMNNRATMG